MSTRPGKHRKSHGNLPIEIDGLPIIRLKMVIFHSYVSLPEGNPIPLILNTPILWSQSEHSLPLPWFLLLNIRGKGVMLG